MGTEAENFRKYAHVRANANGDEQLVLEINMEKGRRAFLTRAVPTVATVQWQVQYF